MEESKLVEVPQPAQLTLQAKKSMGRIDTIEKHTTSGVRIATKAPVPEGNRRQPPFWTPELADLDKAIASKPRAQSSQRLKVRRREIIRAAANSRWRTLCSKLEAPKRKQLADHKACMRPPPPQHASRQGRWGCAF
ncbi:hypothetical protein DQ04_10441030 [Trypanosoma grayi]|uniref:hypothetical protein n=1 Tax=Trypanosoma grayi TaxID=71804 RepID=UPI0004F49974|nr:hypothetical protein DQ04_10441030 [Trypanosoma grayi]KEG07246.1 hypothetical protein DQ04_10441030 [Trypanosoma grayi]